MRYLRVWGTVVVAVLLGGLGSSQPPPGGVQIDNTGAVIPQHRQIHAKNGQTVRWSRTTAGASWHVVFRESPCQNGVTEFGTVGGRPQACTISVQCSRPGDPGCKSYHYTSATAPNAPPNDPEVI